MNIRKYGGWIMLLLWLTAACKKPDFESEERAQATGTISNYLINNFDFSLFAAAVQKAGLTDSLDQATTAFTVLAPLNSAFNKDGVFQPSDFDKWPADSLRYFVRTHVLPVKLFYTDIPLSSDNRYENLNHTRLYVSRSTIVNVALTVNGVQVQPQPSLGSSTNIKYGATQLNGVVYPLSSTLKVMPVTVQDFLSSRPQYSHLIAGLKKFGFWEQLNADGPFTVFAPQDSCFENRGMTLDSISRMDALRYDPAVFGSYFLKPNHVFLLDMLQLPPTGTSYVTFDTPSPNYKMLICQVGVGAGVGVVTAASANTSSQVQVGPYADRPWGDQGTAFLGEPRMTLSITNFKGTYINYTCTNGIVHLMSDILVMPENVTR
ncbi:fasciclin domain-containing protein [Chitinophaga varians]|uniref:Fasciclin domain-containing protein n=1 Tax=Chitinophaga varians TaxID=2202339 RepID=A0A847RX52_9BACT|nr:fasciclin domain-containing protein [Chitinophaga varians]NLR67683.1 fasciclin domain-containing protein [Chitinophaga varians]